MEMSGCTSVRPAPPSECGSGLGRDHMTAPTAAARCGCDTMTDNEASDTEIPHKAADRIEWICERAQRLEFIRDEDWIEAEIRYLWENPDEFEAGDSQDVPADVAKEDYLLFRLGVAFGTDYEHHFPRGEHDGG
jgi:hypothetical protein